MRRTKQQLQQTFDSTLQRIQAQMYSNINGNLNDYDVSHILADIYALRKLMKSTQICTNKRNQAVFSPQGVFIGWG